MIIAKGLVTQLIRTGCVFGGEESDFNPLTLQIKPRQFCVVATDGEAVLALCTDKNNKTELAVTLDGRQLKRFLRSKKNGVDIEMHPDKLVICNKECATIPMHSAQTTFEIYRRNPKTAFDLQEFLRALNVVSLGINIYRDMFHGIVVTKNPENETTVLVAAKPFTTTYAFTDIPWKGMKRKEAWRIPYVQARHMVKTLKNWKMEAAVSFEANRVVFNLQNQDVYGFVSVPTASFKQRLYIPPKDTALMVLDAQHVKRFIQDKSHGIKYLRIDKYGISTDDGFRLAVKPTDIFQPLFIDFPEFKHFVQITNPKMYEIGVIDQIRRVFVKAGRYVKTFSI